jgi:hypothetical protein
VFYLFFFPYSFSFFLTALKLSGQVPRVLKGILDHRLCKSVFTDIWKVSEERLDILFGFKIANSIHNSRLLISLPLAETADFKRLNQVGLMRGELDNPNMVYLSLYDEFRSFVAGSTVD